MKIVICSEDNKPRQSKMPVSHRIGLSLKAQRLTTGIQMALEDNRRALDIAQGFEDMHLVMKKAGTPTPLDVALVQSVSNMVVAGTNLPAQSLAPSFTTPDDKAAAEVALTNRTGDIVNSFVFEIADILNKLGKTNRVRIQQIDEIRSRLISLQASFPLPDDPASDVSRSMIFNPEDKNCLATPEGPVKTLGDLIHQFSMTAAEFSKISKMNNTVCTRLLSVIRQMIPSSKVKSPEELIANITAANASLSATIQDMWQNIILKGDFKFSRDDSKRTLASTKPNLGLYFFRLAYAENANKVTVSDQSENIRSFGAFEIDVDPVTNDEDQSQELSGVTNGLLQLFINDVDRFASDISRYTTWAATMSEVAEQQCNSDILSIRNFFSKEAVDSLDPTTGDTYRTYITMHLGDVNSILQVIQAISLAPAAAMINLINELTTTLTRLQGVVPAGDYNEPKVKPV